MNRDQQAQVNNRSGNIVCDNIRVKEDIILSGDIRGQTESSTIHFNGNIDIAGELSVSKLVRTPSVYLVSGVEEIELQADSGLSESYSYTFPPVGPSIEGGQTIVTTLGGGGSEFYDIHPAYEI